MMAGIAGRSVKFTDISDSAIACVDDGLSLHKRGRRRASLPPA